MVNNKVFIMITYKTTLFTFKSGLRSSSFKHTNLFNTRACKHAARLNCLESVLIWQQRLNVQGPRITDGLADRKCIAWGSGSGLGLLLSDSAQEDLIKCRWLTSTSIITFSQVHLRQTFLTLTCIAESALKGTGVFSKYTRIRRKHFTS